MTKSWKNRRAISRTVLPVMLALVFCSAAKGADFYGTRICIERPGENGRVNVVPVTIELPSMGELTVLGEHEVCIAENSAQSFQQTIRLKFPFPYPGATDKPEWWETQPVPVSLEMGKTTRLLLCERYQDHNDPRWSATGWHDMWVLVSPKKRNLCSQ